MKILNKKAKYNYKLLDKYEAGLVLAGPEVKAIKKGKADISQSYVKIIKGEAFLVNANIPADDANLKSTRTRKLLLHKKQIISILSKITAKGLTVIPTKLYNKGRLIKVEVALAKPKKRFDKRENIRRADLDREAERELRQDKLKHFQGKRI